MILACWAVSAAIAFGPIFSGIFAHDRIRETMFENTDSCFLDVNPIYAVISSSTSFYVPFVVMVFAYVKIFRIALAQSRAIRRQEGHLPRTRSRLSHGGSTNPSSSSNTRSNTISHATNNSVSLVHQSNNCCIITCAARASDLHLASAVPPAPPVSPAPVHTPLPAASPAHANGVLLSDADAGRPKALEAAAGSLHNGRLSGESSRRLLFSRKSSQAGSVCSGRSNRSSFHIPPAIKTLGLIMGLFSLCWFPFFIIYGTPLLCFVCVSSGAKVRTQLASIESTRILRMHLNLPIFAVLTPFCCFPGDTWMNVITWIGYASGVNYSYD